jgi:deoxyhypusine monooxygenase
LPSSSPLLLVSLSSIASPRTLSSRHQAAEALGAISSPSSLPILRAYEADADVSVRETCGLAIKKIEWDNSEEGAREKARKAVGEEQR